MPKRTYIPRRLRGKRTSGFLARMSTKAGRRILRNRRRKGRKRLTISDEWKRSHK